MSPDPRSPTHFRALSRQPVSLPGALRCAAAEHADWNHEARVVDLGLGGACVEVSEPVPAGTAVELVIETPHLWDPLTLLGAVMWARTLPDPEGGSSMVGVRFAHETGATVRALTALLEAEAFG